MSIDTILSRLHKVRATTRDSWIACCPAHEDHNPSMSIRLIPGDGRILMHCFAGCSIDEILDALGCEMSEIMPPIEPRHISHFLKPLRQKFYPADILRMMHNEAVIVGLAAIDIKNGKPLSEQDHERLIKAISRIAGASEYANPN